MPIVPVGQPSRKVLAALMLPAWLQIQSSPTGSTVALTEGLKELEKALED